MRLRRLLAAAVPLGVAALSTLSACSTTANISDIYLALDSAGARRRTIFFTDTKEIHCIAEGSFGRQDVTVEAYIRQVRAYNPADDDFDTVDRYGSFLELTPATNPGGPPQKLDLSIRPTDEKGEFDDTKPFSAGSYKCEFMLDGEVVKSIDFNIDFPECPGAAIFSGDPCIGFYQLNKKCPGGGAKSTDKDTCNCGGPNGWECR